MLIFFFKKNNFIIIVAPINSLNFIDAINLNLLNGIMNIHPCIYLCIFINLLSVYFSFLKSKKMSLDTTLYCFMILLFLGSFWAAQELSWGGWWSWDITECTILYVYLFILYVYHKKIINKFIEIFYLFIIIFLLNKTNLIVSVHSFETTYDNNYIIFVIGLALLFFFFKKKINTLFIIFIYTYNYFYLYLYIFFFFFILFQKNFEITFNFWNFFQFFQKIPKEHFFFFFALFLNFTIYGYFFFYTYNNKFISTNFFLYSEHFYFFNQDFTWPKLIFKNFFKINLDFFFFFFKKINFFICSFNFFFLSLFLVYKKRNFFSL